MSELNAIRSGEIYNIIEYEDCYRTDDLYYPKSEADKVIADLEESHKMEVGQLLIEIAELKNKINEAQTELELWRDGSIISEAHQKELDGKQHSDYKRCVAMAEACMHKRWRTDEGFDYARSTRHMKKWLELAEKFKDGV